MKRKVGDTVRIKSKAWFDAQVKNENGKVKHKNSSFSFGVNMSKYCGKELTIDVVANGFYILKGNDWSWADWMLEDSTPKYTIQRRKFSPVGPIIY